MYLTASEYSTITGRAQAEATTARIRMACRLFDARIGNYVRIDDSSSSYDGYKLDLSNLKTYQQEIVKDWVAWMIAALFLNNDSPQTFASIKLGRFSVNENDGDKDNPVPEQVRYADMQLRDARLINTHVRSTRYISDEHNHCL